MLPSPGLSFFAISIISSHVSGGVGTRSLRYQSNCTFVFVGMPYVLPSHWTDSAGPASTSSSASSFSAPLSSRSQPASANSGVQIVSMLIRSMFLSPAARRRTSSSREMSTFVDSGEISIVYLPPDCWLHSAAAFSLVCALSRCGHVVEGYRPSTRPLRSPRQRWRIRRPLRPQRRCPNASLNSSPLRRRRSPDVRSDEVLSVTTATSRRLAGVLPRACHIRNLQPCLIRTGASDAPEWGIRVMRSARGIGPAGRPPCGCGRRVCDTRCWHVA